MMIILERGKQATASKFAIVNYHYRFEHVIMKTLCHPIEGSNILIEGTAYSKSHFCTRSEASAKSVAS